MNKSQLTKTFLLVLLFSFLFTAAGVAQEKEGKSCGNSCCDEKTKMTHQLDMDHSMMDKKDTTETAEITPPVKEAAVNLQAWNAVCPVRGEVIDPEANKVEYNGKVYGFCCNGCDAKFKKNPEKYSKNLSDDGKSFIGTN